MKVGNKHCLVWVMLFDTLQRALCQCSGTPLTLSATENLAKFSSPGYPTSYSNNLYCEWLLDSGTPGQRILLYSDHYNLDCPLGDKIDVYDGSTTGTSKLGDGLCGQDFTSPEYVSTDRYVLVTFTTDATGVSQGFNMAYISASDTSGTGCTNQYNLTATDVPQYLTSQNFPSKYSSSSSCRWLIHVPDSLSTLDIELMFSDIETDSTCQYDMMVMYDGSYICENTVMFTDCTVRTSADSTPTLYQSTSNSVLVLLTSDSTENRHGFVLKYTAKIVTTTTSTSAAATSTTSSSVTSGNGGATSTNTATETEINIPLMAVSAISGAGAVLLLLAAVYVVKHVMGRKKSKKGLMTVKAIAPLPARPVQIPSRRVKQNALSFV